VPYYTSIYGLDLVLNEQVPGIAVETFADQRTDIQVTFGSMPQWFRPEETAQEIWYVSRDRQADEVPRLVVWHFPLIGHYHVKYADGTEFLIDQHGTRIWATWPCETLTLEDTATYLLGPMMGFVLLLRGCISLHASAVAIHNQAVALVGPAGAGKSTTAAALADLGYRILAEDVVTLEDQDNSFLVQPGYPCIRLWPSSVKALYGDEAELPKLTPTWNKCYLDLTQEKYQFQTGALPLAAIYLLDERSEDASAPYVRTLSPNEALISLISNTYATHLMNRPMRKREFDLLGRVLKAIPVRKLIPHSDPSQIGALCNTLISDFKTLQVIPHSDPSQIGALCNTLISDFKTLQDGHRTLTSQELALHV
jgi:hypothetical protein